MKFLYLYIIILSVLISRGQNLVPNAGFETYTLCPTNSCNIELYANSWTSATANSSTDYFNTCSPSCKLSTNNARTGNGYAGLFFLWASTSTSNSREYLQVELTSDLVQNRSYYVEFFVMLRNISSISGCNNVSANFSIIRPYTTAFGILQPLTPHIMNPGNPIIDDKVNWVKISGCYTAQGGEKYLTIGNFMDDSQTQTSGIGPTPQSYYIIDDVLVEEITGSCTTGVNELSISEVKLFPNPVGDALHINVPNFKNKEALIVKLYDVLGKEALSAVYKEELDLSGLEKGIYFLSLYQDNQLLVTKKVVKE